MEIDRTFPRALYCAIRDAHPFLLAAIASALPLRELHAHAGEPLAPHDLPLAWETSPAILAPLLLLTAFAARGLRRASRGRGHRRRSSCFVAAILALVVALVSPLHAAGGALFSAHMVQHGVLTMVAAPLLVAADAWRMLRRSLPRAPRRALGAVLAQQRVHAALRMLTAPTAAFLLHAAALLLWHLPPLYDAGVADDRLHALEHASFFVTALLFWHPVLAPRKRVRLSLAVGALYLFAATLASGALGAALALSGSVWYDAHLATTGPFGLSPLDDQRLAGLIMWVPAGLIYLGTLVPMVARALADRDGIVSPHGRVPTGIRPISRAPATSTMERSSEPPLAV
jgi:putative membrane protein